MSKRKRTKKKKTKPSRTISESANPTRFLIFLAIGLALFLVFMYFVVTRNEMLQ